MNDCFHFGQDRRTANQNILFNDQKLRTQASEVRPGCGHPHHGVIKAGRLQAASAS